MLDFKTRAPAPAPVKPGSRIWSFTVTLRKLTICRRKLLRGLQPALTNFWVTVEDPCGPRLMLSRFCESCIGKSSINLFLLSCPIMGKKSQQLVSVRGFSIVDIFKNTGCSVAELKLLGKPKILEWVPHNLLYSLRNSLNPLICTGSSRKNELRWVNYVS